jgi:lysophospholipase L1-like esterase
MPRADRDARTYTTKIRKLNSLVEKFVRKDPNFDLCDTWTALTDAHGQQKAEDFRPDHLHLNAAGYAVWKSALDPVMANLHPANGRAE